VIVTQHSVLDLRTPNFELVFVGAFATAHAAVHATMRAFEGYFMYARGNAAGKSATLTSPTLRHAQDMKVCFFYHMYGSGVGKLSFSLLESGKAPVELWSKSGNQGNQWIQGCLNVSARGNPYSVG